MKQHPILRRLLTVIGVVTVLFHAPVMASPSACEARNIRAMTYNIRLDTTADGINDWSHRRTWLTDQMMWLGPDIFGLQEVVINQKRDIARDLPDYRLIGNGRDDGHDAGESSPIGFNRNRFDLLDSGTFWLSPTPNVPGKGWDAAYPRVATWARLRTKSGQHRILAVNTHWDHIGVEARRQSGTMLRRWLAANAASGDHIIFLGDFNTAIDSDAMVPLIDPANDRQRLRDARAASLTAAFGPAGTFNAFRLQPDNAPTIDHILVGDSILVRRYAVIAQNIDGRMISDHYPVLTDLELGPPCPPVVRLGQQISVPASANTYPYLLFAPANYQPSSRRRHPLMLFLHGSGERGSDIRLVATHGPPNIVQSQPDFPFITISPQLEASGDWDITRLEATLAHAQRLVRIDARRMVLTGLSRGGHASWRWAAARPGLFAAVVPIAGRGDTASACALRSTPIWAFHGADDSVVPPSGSSDMIDAISACGGARATLTRYDGVGHDSWTRSYADPALYTWINAQLAR
ncbi:MAG: endonuclease/exonuclease/phosphatase family protein [Sphingopyxis sp.]